MEVHAHTHTARKKWTHYFWEFLMLFLAVFCGFLAENKREHMVEHQRERRYMSTLIEDLKGDTIQFGSMGRFIRQCLSRYDKNSPKLRPPVAPNNLEIYYMECFEVYNFYAFAYNDRTIEQLRSSGNFRIIRNKNVIELLLHYDQKIRGGFILNFDVLWNHRLKMLSIQNDIVDKGFSKYFNFDTGIFYLDSLNKSGLLPFKLLTDDAKVLFKYYNEWTDNIIYLADFLDWIDYVNNNAKELILLVQKEYHLE